MIDAGKNLSTQFRPIVGISEHRKVPLSYVHVC